MKLKIMTYNIHGGRGVDRKCDYKRIGEFLKSENIDIVLLQEVDTRAQTRNASADLKDLMSDHFQQIAKAPTLQNDHGWYGNAILSRHPIYKENIIDITEPYREPRNILEAFIETSFGPLHVVNTHKGLNSSERLQQIEKLNQLLSRESDIPLIVGGDLNHWNSYSKALHQLDSRLHAIVPGPTFPTSYPLLSLDRLWCRPSHLFATANVLKTRETRIFSDHYPVVVEIHYKKT